MNLTLFSSEHCELCDQAEQLIHQTLGTAEYRLVHVDIGSSIALQKQYGLKIPVLMREQDEASALYWPFGPEQIRQLVATGRDRAGE